MAKENRIGPTGQFPDGKAYPTDKGELCFRIGVDSEKKLIVVEFGTPVTSLGLKPEQAVELADDLINKANQLTEMNNGT